MCTINNEQLSGKDNSGSLLSDNEHDGEGVSKSNPCPFSFVIGECVPGGPLSSSLRGLLIV